MTPDLYLTEILFMLRKITFGIDLKLFKKWKCLKTYDTNVLRA